MGFCLEYYLLNTPKGVKIECRMLLLLAKNYVVVENYY